MLLRGVQLRRLAQVTLSAPASPVQAFSARGSGEAGAFTSPQSRGVRGGKLGAGNAPPATTQEYDMSHRTIEVRHEGGTVYLDGRQMTSAEADSLARLLQVAASDARGWAAAQRTAAEMADKLARLEASGLTHITHDPQSGYLARRDGLPVVVTGCGESPALRRGQVGDGPPLEARVRGGRKWRPLSELQSHQRVSEWRVKP